MKKKALSVALSAILLLPAFSVSSFAVTGNAVAADGSYSGSASKIGTVTVTVSNGKIAGLTCSKANKSSYKTLVNNWLSKVNGAAATYNTIDAVSAATSGKYGSGLKNATLAALETAPEASGGSSSGGSSSGGSSSGGSSSGTVTGGAVPDGTYSGEGSSVGTITVTVSGGKVTNVTCSKATKSSYQTLVTSWLDKIRGLTASYETIDAVTAATSGKYGTGLKSGTLAALKSASGSSSGGSSGGSSGSTEEPWSDPSEVGQGIGSKTGMKYTGTGTIEDEYVKLDVYVNNGKIAGVFIAEEAGTWLSLLTDMQNSFIGASASSETIDAITSGTTLGFRDTLRNAVSNALKSAGGNTPNSQYKADGWDKEYSYNTLKKKQYYYLYKGTYYPITPVYDRSMSKDKPYAAYIQVNGTRYYLDKADDKTYNLPTKWEGEKSATKKLYESAEADDDRDDQLREPQLYTLS